MSWHATGLRASSVTASPLALDVADRAILVVGWGGRWYAVEDRCSHAGCRFSEDGEIDGDRILCDCHGSEFDLTTGAVMHGPAFRPLPTFPVRVRDDGTVEIDVDAPSEARA